MSAPPFISTIIATCNRAPMLMEALDNLAAQQLPPTEVIVVDDGSGPATRHAVDDWRASRAAPFTLRYFHQRNSGPAVARNRGIDASRGDLIHFMDDDDLMAPEALRHLAAALAGVAGAALGMASYALLQHGAALDDAPAVTPYRGSAAQVLAAMIAGQWFVPVHGYLFTRAAIRRMGHWNPVFSSQEDDEFLLRAALRGVDFIAAPAAMVYYRQHDGVRRATPGKPGETLAQGLRKRLRDDLGIREQVAAELRADGDLERYRAAFHAWHLRLVERYGVLLQEREGDDALLAWLRRAAVPALPRAPALRDGTGAPPRQGSGGGGGERVMPAAPSPGP